MEPSTLAWLAYISLATGSSPRLACQPEEGERVSTGVPALLLAGQVGHAAEAADPQAAVGGAVHREDGVGEQAIGSGQDLELFAVAPGQPVVGADPQVALGVLVQHEDVVAGQPVLDGVVPELLAVEVRQPAAPGAGPHGAVAIGHQRDDVVRVVGGVDTLQPHFLLLPRVVARYLGRVVLERLVVLHQVVISALAFGMVPVVPFAAGKARQAALGGQPDDAVLALGQAVDPVVRQATLGVLDRVQLPLG